MNRGFVLVVLLVLVLDWVIVFEDEEEHEDESVHGPNAFPDNLYAKESSRTILYGGMREQIPA